jgi:methenyltetrahydrofolate cyclohydrolase
MAELDSRAMAALAEQRLADFLDAVAAPTPAPGGGSSAGIVCALAAALVEMAAGIGEAGDAAAAARALCGRALALAELELTAYAPVLEARRLPADDPARRERIAAALEQASAVPREIAAVADEVVVLARRVGTEVSAAVRGDAETGRLLAEAAGAAAALLVETNLREG